MKKALLIIVLLVTSISVKAQERASGFALQADLSPYVFSGYSVKGVWFPKWFKKGSIGLESFKMNYPDFYFSGDNKDWQGEVEYGFDLTLDFSLSEDRFQGFSMGPMIVYLHNRMFKEQERVEFDIMQVAFKANYRWFPFKNSRFYVNPYAVIGFDVEVGGDPGTYKPNVITGLGSVFVGFLF